MEAYEKGADGQLAVWALKAYWGHQMHPKDGMLVDYNWNNPNSMPPSLCNARCILVADIIPEPIIIRVNKETLKK